MKKLITRIFGGVQPSRLPEPTPAPTPLPGELGSMYHNVDAFEIVYNFLFDTTVKIKSHDTDTFFDLRITEVKLDDSVYYVQGIKMVRTENKIGDETIQIGTEVVIDSWIHQDDIFVDLFW